MIKIGEQEIIKEAEKFKGMNLQNQWCILLCNLYDWSHIIKQKKLIFFVSSLNRIITINYKKTSSNYA